MISVGNSDVAEYYAIILMSTLLWVNLISLISFIDIFTGQSINIYFGSKIMILLEYFIVTCIFYSLFIRKKQYLDIAKDYENESIKERIKGKAFAICYFILSLALMIFGFYLMMMKNRGEL
jgi:hypothetical protein